MLRVGPPLRTEWITLLVNLGMLELPYRFKTLNDDT